MARATAEGSALDVEAERFHWVLAAEPVLSAERIGPRELTTLFREARPEDRCLALPPERRLRWLASAPAEGSGGAAAIECLIAALEDPTSPVSWTTADP